MRKIKNILIGWGKSWQLIPTAEAEKKLSQLRLSVCVSCPESAQSNILKFINGQAIKEKQIICKVCKCPCEQKTLVVSEKCPLNKW